MAFMVAVVSDVDPVGGISDKMMVVVLNIGAAIMAGWYHFVEWLVVIISSMLSRKLASHWIHYFTYFSLSYYETSTIRPIKVLYLAKQTHEYLTQKKKKQCF